MGLANKLHVRIVALRKIFRQYPMILPFSTIIRDAKKASGPKWHLIFDIVMAITKNLLIRNRLWRVHDVLFAKRCVASVLT